MRRPLHMALRGVFSQTAPVSCPSYPAYSSRWVFTFLQDVCLKDRRISWDSSSRTLLANFLRVEFLGRKGPSGHTRNCLGFFRWLQKT